MSFDCFSRQILSPCRSRQKKADLTSVIHYAGIPLLCYQGCRSIPPVPKKTICENSQNVDISQLHRYAISLRIERATAISTTANLIALGYQASPGQAKCLTTPSRSYKPLLADTNVSRSNLSNLRRMVLTANPTHMLH